MANIMLTDCCNLHCSYCFANEFVNHSSNEISEQCFLEALSFIATGNSKVGLIGGEPTLHSNFKHLLQLLIKDSRFKNVMLYTNGVLIDKYINELVHPKFRLLINCNSEEDMGQIAFNKMCNNLDNAIQMYYMKDRITLGFNIYKNNQDYDYLLRILRKHHFHKVRISITVPNTLECRSMNAYNYFLDLKPYLLEFLHTMMKNGIIPYYDCNKMPECVLTEKEKADLYETYYQLSPSLRNDYTVNPDLSIVTDLVQCEPVIDIRQDLTAVRCFGLSECTKTSIKNFKSIDDLRRYYILSYDTYASKSGITTKCYDCYKKKVLHCTGGCYAYQLNTITNVKKMVEEYFAAQKE